MINPQARITRVAPVEVYALSATVVVIEPGCSTVLSSLTAINKQPLDCH